MYIPSHEAWVEKDFSKPSWYNWLYSVIVKTEDLFLQWTEMFLTLLIARVSQRLHSYASILEAHWCYWTYIGIQCIKTLMKACICDLKVLKCLFCFKSFLSTFHTVSQLCSTLWGPPWTVDEIFPGRILDWVAISSSGIFWPRSWTHIYCISCTVRQTS